MKSKKTLKKALLSSVLALVLCFTMLIGTTYAWFTDSVTSSGNIIKSGTLNIDLLVKGGDTGYTEYTSVKQTAAPVFNYKLWEPGYTVWANAKVTTTGNLALKYTMRIVADGEVSALAEVIDVYYAPADVAQPATRPADLAATGLVKLGTLADALAGRIVINDTLIPGTNEADFATLALHMQETAGNEYQDLSIGASFSLQILATQYTYEEDSFDDQYDAGAAFPEPVAGVFSNVTDDGVEFNVGDTNVVITDLDGVEVGEALALNVETIGLDEASENSDFVVANDQTAIAGIDLTLVDTANQKVTFSNGTATVTTKIVPGLDPNKVSVKYNGEGAAPTFVSYDATTGELVFTTTHFSEFYAVYEGSFAYVPQLKRAFAGNDPGSDALDAITIYAESKLTNLDKLDVEGLVEFYNEEAFPADAHTVIKTALIGGCQGDEPSYVEDWVLGFVEGGTDVLAMAQAYFDAYKCVESVKFYPVGGGVWGWAPWPMGVSLGGL